MSKGGVKWQRRAYQKEALVAARRGPRVFDLFWARQTRKSSTLGEMAFDRLSGGPGRTVIATSASLLVGAELVTKAMTAAEQAAMVAGEAAALQGAMARGTAGAAEVRLVTADAETKKELTGVTAEDFVELYRTSRLEMRLYHGRTDFSRLQVIAPHPATARGWSGTVFFDEKGFVPAGRARELEEAIAPIIDTQPTFRLIGASNLPADDRHPFFEETLAPIGVELPANAKGNWYRGLTGVMVHRVTLEDAYLAGHVLFDKKEGAPLTLEQFLASGIDRGALDRNYMLVHRPGGTAAIDYVALDTAQRRGVGRCLSAQVECDGDFERALGWLAGHVGDGEIGLGFDVATTTRGTSNPSSLTVTERRGVEYRQVLNVLWKERHAKAARERLRRVIECVKGRKAGGPARRLCIDATSERYFADETRQELAGALPVELVVAGARIEPAGYPEPTNFKIYLGDLSCKEVNDNRYWMPPERHYAVDHRRVVRDRGSYECEPDAQTGAHGDTFDSGKLAQWALMAPECDWRLAAPAAVGDYETIYA